MTVRLLFVCAGNLCRSPMAQGICATLAAGRGMDNAVRTDSAGTHAWMAGSAPDARAQAAVAPMGVDISAIRARRIRPVDISTADLILAMDDWNRCELDALCDTAERRKLRMLTDYAIAPAGNSIEDPYGGNEVDFRAAAALIRDCCEGLLETLAAEEAGSR